MARWTLDDIDWQSFDRSRTDEDTIRIIKAASLVEFNANDYARYLERVFAGDAGSLFVGSVYAISALAMAGKGFAGSVWLAPLFVLVFLADVLLTLLRRVRHGRFNLNAHSEHAYQRLVKSGWSHAHVGLAYGGITSVIVLTGLFAAQAPEWAPFLVFILWTGVLILAYGWVGRLTKRQGIEA